MRNRQRYLVLSLTLLVLFLCWGLALNRAQWLEHEYQGVSVRILGTGISEQALNEAISDDNTHNAPLRLSAWNRSAHKITLANESIGGAAKARRIAVLGHMADVCPMKVLYGALPSSADESGCVIDAETALALYRNIDVVGARLKLDTKSYIVRAVVSSLEPMILLRETGALYNNLELQYSDTENGGAYAAEFLYRYGLADEYEVVENGFFSKLAAELSLLPGRIIFVAVLILPLWGAWKRRNIPLQLITLLGLAAIAFVLLKWLLDLTTYWPDRFLPTRWSDFEFWPKLAHELRTYFSDLRFLPPMSKELQWSSAIGSLMLYTGIASAATVRFLLSFRGENDFDARGLICITLCCVSSAGLLHMAGTKFIPSNGFLFAAPVWWLAVNCKNIVSIKLKGSNHRPK